MEQPVRCPHCATKVLVATSAGRTVLLDPAPVAHGRWRVDKDTGVAHRMPAGWSAPGLVPHQATCPRWGELPPGSPQASPFRRRTPGRRHGVALRRTIARA